MRPPQITGENQATRNGLYLGASSTSMRPPQITGENNIDQILHRLRQLHFNEAPADHGGKRPSRTPRNCAHAHFNEAPADHGGKQDLAVQARAHKDTSMRPPQITGENSFISSRENSPSGLQ